MHEQDKAILQGLVSVAWSDGSFEQREKEMLDALIESFGASEQESKEIKAYAATQRGLEDIPLTELSYADRRHLMAHAVTLSFIDGAQAEAERTFLEKLRDHLKISPEEFADINAASTKRAEDLLKLLNE
jgi:DnaJ-domain-containing protein 1